MSNFEIIPAEKFDYSPFRMIGEDWMLIAAEKDGKVNAMTASWGGLGVIWNKNVAYIFIRESRYTKEFIDQSSSFSLTFFDHKADAKMLGYMGSASGRDEDKIENMGLTVQHQEGVPYFEEALTVMICNKITRIPIDPKDMPEEVNKKFYKEGNYHDMYIGEVVQILCKHTK